MKKVLLLGGHALNGKDSTAIILRDYFELRHEKSIVLHYADMLKFVCKLCFDWNGIKDENGRHILQHVGTNLARRNYPTVWVDIVIALTKALFIDYDYVIVADFRFPDEHKTWVEEGFDTITIKVVRKNFESPLTLEQQSHPSETALDDYEFDYTIESENGLDNLKIEVEKFIGYLKEIC
jgi:hypothetical protein